jgi:DNA-binding transcriptional regulator YiaG
MQDKNVNIPSGYAMKRVKSRKNTTIIRQLRERLNLSQEELGRLMDVSVFQVSRWERGETKFQLELKQYKKFVSLLKSVGLSIHDLPDDIWEELPIAKIS